MQFTCNLNQHKNKYIFQRLKSFTSSNSKSVVVGSEKLSHESVAQIVDWLRVVASEVLYSEKFIKHKS